MQVEYSENAQQWPEGYRLIQNATEVLADVMLPSTDPLRVEWSSGIDNQGLPLYTLRISDVDDSATAQFTLEDLRSTHYLRFLLAMLFGKILQERGHRQLQLFQESGS